MRTHQRSVGGGEGVVEGGEDVEEGGGFTTPQASVLPRRFSIGGGVGGGGGGKGGGADVGGEGAGRAKQRVISALGNAGATPNLVRQVVSAVEEASK